MFLDMSSLRDRPDPETTVEGVRRATIEVLENYGRVSEVERFAQEFWICMQGGSGRDAFRAILLSLGASLYSTSRWSPVNAVEEIPKVVDYFMEKIDPSLFQERRFPADL